MIHFILNNYSNEGTIHPWLPNRVAGKGNMKMEERGASWGPCQTGGAGSLAKEKPAEGSGSGVACGMGGILVCLRIDAQAGFVVEPGTGESARALAALAAAGGSVMVRADEPYATGSPEAMG